MPRKKLTAEERLEAREVADELFFGIDHHPRSDPASDVGNGAWVLVTQRVPVAEEVRPRKFGIYWALPCEKDRWGRQKVRVYTPSEVCLLVGEYSLVSEARLQEYRALGYRLHDSGRPQGQEMRLDLIEQGRALCEEEREIIWAMQLDGLTETAACEEYFLGRHTDDSHVHECFLPPPELEAELATVFGA